MKFPALRLLAVLIAASSAWSDEPPNAPETTAESDSDDVLLESTADAPRMTLSYVIDLFSPHYNVEQFPMLADPKAREFMEVGTYRQLYWILTGGERTPELQSSFLLTPQDAVHYIKSAEHAWEGFRKFLGELKATGVAFPEKAITFFRSTPAAVHGARMWDGIDPNSIRTDADIEFVYARVRCIVEIEDGTYFFVGGLWVYEPEKIEFVFQSARFEKIDDGLTMLMRLHSDKDPAEW